jgi:hypothetical protein
MYDAEGAGFHDTSVEILKQCAIGEEENPEPEPNERTMMVLKFTEGLGSIAAGIKVLRTSISKGSNKS